MNKVSKHFYYLQCKNSGLILKRWPGKNDSPALWTDNVNSATIFKIEDFQGLAGYWDYAREDCKLVITKGENNAT